MDKLDRIIKESLERCILKESYKGDLYHFTSIGLAYDIMKDNVIYSREDSSEGEIDRRMANREGSEKVISLSRSGSFGEGYEKNSGISIRFTIDGEKLASNDKILPYSYFGFPTEFSQNVTRFSALAKKYVSISEFEERYYGHDIYPLDKYCKRIDILVRNIATTDDSEILNCDDADFDYVPKYDSDNQYYNTKVNQQLINDMVNMPRWKGKVFVHYKNKRIFTQYEINKKQQ